MHCGDQLGVYCYCQRRLLGPTRFIKHSMSTDNQESRLRIRIELMCGSFSLKKKNAWSQVNPWVLCVRSPVYPKNSRPTRVAANRAPLGDSFIAPEDMEHLSVKDNTEFPASGACPISDWENRESETRVHSARGFMVFGGWSYLAGVAT